MIKTNKLYVADILNMTKKKSNCSLENQLEERRKRIDPIMRSIIGRFNSQIDKNEFRKMIWFNDFKFEPSMGISMNDYTVIPPVFLVMGLFIPTLSNIFSNNFLYLIEKIAERETLSSDESRLVRTVNEGLKTFNILVDNQIINKDSSDESESFYISYVSKLQYLLFEVLENVYSTDKFSKVVKKSVINELIHLLNYKFESTTGLFDSNILNNLPFSPKAFRKISIAFGKAPVIVQPLKSVLTKCSSNIMMTDITFTNKQFEIQAVDSITIDFATLDAQDPGYGRLSNTQNTEEQIVFSIKNHLESPFTLITKTNDNLPVEFKMKFLHSIYYLPVIFNRQSLNKKSKLYEANYGSAIKTSTNANLIKIKIKDTELIEPFTINNVKYTPYVIIGKSSGVDGLEREYMLINIRKDVKIILSHLDKEYFNSIGDDNCKAKLEELNSLNLQLCGQKEVTENKYKAWVDQCGLDEFLYYSDRHDCTVPVPINNDQFFNLKDQICSTVTMIIYLSSQLPNGNVIDCKSPCKEQVDLINMNTTTFPNGSII